MTPQDYHKRIHIGVDEDLSENETFRKLVATMWPNATCASPDDRRKNVRHTTDISCVIKVERKDNQIIVLPGVIRNISTCGMLLELRDKGHLHAAMFKEIETFQVALVLNDSIAANVTCIPRHLEMDNNITIGVQVNGSTPASAANTRYLM